MTSGVKTSREPSLESLIAWLEKQPADERYDWTAAESCCIGQWLASLGVSDLFGKSNKIALQDPFYEIAVAGPSGEGHTFGKALERARAVRPLPSADRRSV